MDLIPIVSISFCNSYKFDVNAYKSGLCPLDLAFVFLAFASPFCFLSDAVSIALNYLQSCKHVVALFCEEPKLSEQSSQEIDPELNFSP